MATDRLTVDEETFRRAMFDPGAFVKRAKVVADGETWAEADWESLIEWQWRALIAAVEKAPAKSNLQRLAAVPESEATKVLATIRSWCDDNPASDEHSGGWLLASHVADFIDGETAPHAEAA